MWNEKCTLGRARYTYICITSGGGHTSQHSWCIYLLIATGTHTLDLWSRSSTYISSTIILPYYQVLLPGKVHLWKLSLIQEKCTYSTPSVEISTRSGFSVRDRSWQLTRSNCIQNAFKWRSDGVRDRSSKACPRKYPFTTVPLRKIPFISEIYPCNPEICTYFRNLCKFPRFDLSRYCLFF